MSFQLTGQLTGQLTNFPKKVKIVEVGARDGLQNEPNILDVKTKVELINRLAQAGLQHIEAGAFVSPKKIPQMADSAQVFAGIDRIKNVTYTGLVPNLMGFEAALAAKADEVAIFAAASETFSKRNINCTIDESFERFAPVMHAAKQAKIPVRGYLSCVLGCPYEGKISVQKVAVLSKKLWDMGCHEISLGDTIGVGVVSETYTLIEAVRRSVPIEKIAVHFHDTYGQALANIIVALQMGVMVVDSSVAGLGGCPYAVGASGNVSTEDVVYGLNKMGIQTGVNLDLLVSVGEWISKICKRSNSSKAGVAIASKQ